MASKYGYMVNVGADVSGLKSSMSEAAAALKTADKEIASARGQLAELSKSLKLDPENVVLLGQKFGLVSQEVDATREKLKLLDSANAALTQALSEGKIDQTMFNKYQRDTEAARIALKQYDTELEGLKGKLDGASGAVGEAAQQAKQLEAMPLDDKLAAINKALAITPENAELAAQKLSALRDKLTEAEAALEQLKSRETEVNYAYSAGTMSKDEYEAYRRELISASSAVDNLRGELDKLKTEQAQVKAAVDGTTGATKDLGAAAEQASGQTSVFKDVFNANIISSAALEALRNATQYLKGFVSESVEVAKNLVEVQNVIDVTFGSDAEAVSEWAKNAATAYGISELAAKQYAGTMGAMLKSSGVATEAVAEMSEGVTGLAGDLASFYNLKTDVAFEKIRSGISGEIEPLRQLGIDMSVANLQAYALSQGIETAWKSMSQAEQVQLRYNYLLSVTADAQGDFVRTQDSVANQQRVMELNVETMKEELGNKLLPIVNRVLQTLSGDLPNITEMLVSVGDGLADVADWVIKNETAVKALAASTGTFIGVFAAGAALEKGITAYKAISAAVKGATVATEALNAANAVNPWMLLASAVAAVTVGIVSYVKSIDDAYNSTNELKKSSDELISKSEVEAQTAELKAQRYRELYAEYEKTGKKTSELTMLAKELQELSPDTIKLIDDETGAYLALGDSIDGVILKIRQKGIEEARSDSTSRQYDNIEEYTKKIYAAEKTFLEDMQSNGIDDDMLAELSKDNFGKYKDYLDYSKANDLENFDYINSQINAYMNATEKRDKVEDEYNAKIKKQQEQITETNKVYDSMLTELSEKSAETAGSSAESENAKAAVVAKTTSAMADYYKKQGEAQVKSSKSLVEQQKEYEEALQAGMSKIDSDYAKHKYVLSDGTKDEATYYRKQLEYLNEHVDKSSEVWWKYYDTATEALTKLGKTATDDTDKTVSAVEDATDGADLSGLTKAAESTGKSLVDIGVKTVKQLQDTEEKSQKEWESSVSDTVDSIAKSYEQLADKKQQAADELSGIRLTSTVKGEDGGDLSYLTDLDAERQKLQQYEADIARLKATGISDALMSEITDMSYSSGDRQAYMDQLLGLSKPELEKYYADYAEYQKEVQAASQQEVQSDLDALNTQTASTVSDIFGSQADSAYTNGYDTARSYLQGIADGMGGLNDAQTAALVLSGGAGQSTATSVQQNSITSAVNTAVSGVLSSVLGTPITININDTKSIKRTISELISANRVTGGNNLEI